MFARNLYPVCRLRGKMNYYHLRRILVFFLVLFFTLEASAQTKLRYEYKVKYGFVTAGSALLEFDATTSDSLISRFTIKSSSWLSRLWKLNDSIESTFDLTHNRLMSHKKRIHEGKYHRDYKVQFSWDDSVVTINEKQEVLANQHFLDIPTLLYSMRATELKVGDTLIYALFDGQNAGRLSLLIQKIEPIEVHGNKIPAYVLIPLERSRKADQNELSLSIWLSADKPHYPVQLAIATRFGNAIMTLEDD